MPSVALPSAGRLLVSSLTRQGGEKAREAMARGALACFDKAQFVSHARDFRKLLKKSMPRSKTVRA